MYFIRQSILIYLIAFVFVFILCVEINAINEAFKSGNKNSIQITKRDNKNNNIKNTDFDLNATININLYRKNYLEKQCKALGYNSLENPNLTNNQMDHMFVDHKHKVLYCYVPKVACTNWKRVLMILTGKWKKGTDPLQIPHELSPSAGTYVTLRSLSPTERNDVLTTYTRFMFVRNPFERLLSAYRNKIEDTKTDAKFHKDFQNFILKSRHANTSKYAPRYSDEISFVEFVTFILTAELKITHHGSHNEHWEPMSKLCNPCVMQYHVIGKYETLLNDSDLIFYLIGVKNITFPYTRSAKTHNLLRKYYDTLPLGDIRRLYELYADDFKLFNYGLDNVLGFESN